MLRADCLGDFQLAAGTGRMLLAALRSSPEKVPRSTTYREDNASTVCYLVPNLFRRYDSTVAVSSAVRMRL
jgi:hypothetical protein